jgi:phage baseplate assembly protein W
MRRMSKLAQSSSGSVDLIGTGWKFPVKLNARGGLSWSTGPDRIREAIWIVLATAQGERVMRPTFGAGAQTHVFDPNSNVSRTRLAADIRDALTRWEPRITLVNVDVREGDEPSRVDVTIDYTIRTTNELFNLVFPLYVQEGVG